MPKRKSIEHFLQDAIAVHGKTYDYSLVEYKNTDTKVKIICPIHGVFEQTPHSHIAGRGCRYCGGTEKLNTQTFIKKAIALHGNKYDYCNVKYELSHIKVEIICPSHGMFLQSPNTHLCGKGCPMCGNEQKNVAQKLSTSEFIQRATAKHAGTYDYSLVDYKNNHTPVKIICPIHGIFEQTPTSHIGGAGCIQCRTPQPEMLLKEFVHKSIAVHGDKYDYSMSSWNGQKKKTTIICAVHGMFSQTPGNHLAGRGCPECGKDNSARKQKKSTKCFIDAAQKKHAGTYDYSLVDYKNNYTPVKIICPIHGIFEQIPFIHLQGSGCRYCGGGGFDRHKPGLLYFLKIEKPFATFFKIGVTNRTIKERLGSDHDFVTYQKNWHFLSGDCAYYIEQSVLAQFHNYRFDRVFLFSLLRQGGDTECFLPSLPHEKVIAFIEKQAGKISALS